jgi:acetyltransferase-like isoleucine patch superfamily enzyme
VKIFDNNHRFSREEGVIRECAAGCITVGRNCWIASDVVLLKGTDIGDNCVIGAGCVIRGKVPAGSLVTRSGEQTTRPIETR